MSNKRKIKTFIYHFGMIAFSFIMLYPLLWLISASFKPEPDIMLSSIGLIPERVTLDHYINGWKGFGRYTFSTFYKNSIFISVISTVGAVVSDTLCAYGFARIKFKFRGVWFAIMISTMALPGIVMMVPTYLLYNSLGWVGTFLPLTVSSFFGSGSMIFMLMQFMKTIPREMDEAARIDGCGRFRMFFNIMLPLVRPAVVMVAVNSFMGAWGNYMGPLLYLRKPGMYPVAFALKMFADDQGYNIGPSLAMNLVSLIPIFILFACFQKQLIEGIATTGVKG